MGEDNNYLPSEQARTKSGNNDQYPYSLKFPIGHGNNPVENIVRKLEEIHSIPLPQYEAITMLANRLYKFETRRSIWKYFEEHHVDSAIVKRLIPIRNALGKLSNFSTDKNSLTVQAKSILESQDSFDTLGDFTPISGWLDRSPDIYREICNVISLIEEHGIEYDNYHDLLHNHNAGQGANHKYKTELMGNLLPSLFCEIYPNVPVYSIIKEIHSDGAIYTFIHLVLNLFGYRRMDKNWGIDKAIIKLGNRSKFASRDAPRK